MNGPSLPPLLLSPYDAKGLSPSPLSLSLSPKGTPELLRRRRGKQQLCLPSQYRKREFSGGVALRVFFPLTILTPALAC